MEKGEVKDHCASSVQSLKQPITNHLPNPFNPITISIQNQRAGADEAGADRALAASILGSLLDSTVVCCVCGTYAVPCSGMD